MSQDQNAPFPFPVPAGFTPVEPASVAPDALAWSQRANAELERARAEAEAEQKQTVLAHQRWQFQQEHSHDVRMAQVPKLVIACGLGVVLAYLLPMGEDR